MSVKVEFRAEPEQRERWKAAAESESLKFSQWARQVLDAALPERSSPPDYALDEARALAGADVGSGVAVEGRLGRAASVPASVPVTDPTEIAEDIEERWGPSSPGFAEAERVRELVEREPPTEPERISPPPRAPSPPLAPNCRDAALHWRLAPGGMCKWCQGYAP